MVTPDLIYSSLMDSPVGAISLFCNETHLLRIWFGEHPDLTANSHPLLHWTEQQITEYFAGKRKQFELPLAANGTPFQEKVWTTLQTIPYGQCLSYSQLAQRMGQLKAIRAVAAANGKNPLPILIPCHRVIGQNGSLVGFTGGLAIKKKLLDLEAEYCGVQLFPL